MLHTKNESNENIDWWFIYKTPEHTGSETNEGYQYFYYDESATEVTLSPYQLNDTNGALYNTLNTIFNSNDANQGYIIYNDEHVEGDKNNGEKGHTKGILAFNDKANTGLWLLHSVPRFPAKDELTLPDKEKIYGQTFICITLPDFKTVEDLAQIMLQQQNPQVLTSQSYIPNSIAATSPIAQLFNQTNIEESTSPAIFNFNSKGGKAFKLIAKSKKWGKDFWMDLVSPELGVNLDVETWRRGTVTESTDAGITEEVDDAIQIDFSSLGYPYQWKYTKDHSKWAVAAKADALKSPWVCIADINRMKSQEKRGGGSICFQDLKLSTSLRNTITQLKEEYAQKNQN